MSGQREGRAAGIIGIDAEPFQFGGDAPRQLPIGCDQRCAGAGIEDRFA